MSLRTKCALIAGAVAIVTLSSPSSAATFTNPAVNATASLYQFAGSNDNGTAPYVIDLSGLSANYFTVTATGSTSFNGGSNIEDADGVGSAQGINSTGYGSFSGIVAPHAGFLTGVFTTATPNGAAPATTTYTLASIGNASFAPALNQLFFIGDGLTGDGAGAAQQFFVPVGATRLVLGFADACGYSGSPGCYSDNSGSLAVTATSFAAVGGVPEPATWAMMLGGFGLIGAAMRRRTSHSVFTQA